MADAVCRARPETSYVNLPPGERLGLMAKLGKAAPAALHELERLVKRKAKPALSDLSPELSLYLLQPAKKLGDGVKQVLHRLLARWQPADVVQMFAYDKEFFYRQYQSWPAAKREWAVDFILKQQRR